MKTSSLFATEAGASTGLQFIKAYNSWYARIKSCLAHCRITHPQFVFLTCAAYLARSHAHVTQAMIAAASDMDMMTISQLAVLLEKKEFITRAPHPTDSRAKSIALTRLGLATVEQSLPLVEGVDALFFAQLGKDEPAFRRMLAQLSLRDQKPTVDG